METKMEQLPANNPNPVLSVANDGTVLYSNVAGEPLLHEWGVGIGEKLPSCIGDFVQKVISWNSPEKMEVKVGKRVYSVAFHPLPDEEFVNIYGFDISDQKELEEKYHNIVEKSMPCQVLLDENHALRDEIQSLRARLEEPEELQRAIREGDLDALVMPVSEEDVMVFTLNGADQAYRTLMETANEDVLIVDAEFKITYAGKRLINKIGYSQEEVIGRSWLDFVDEESKVYSDLRMNKRRQGSNENYELKLMRQNGSPLWILASSKSLFDENGKFKGALSMLTDITERKQTEEELAAAHSQIQSIIDNTPDIIYAFDLEERFMLANKAVANVLNSTPDRMIGKRRHEFMPKMDADWHEANDRQVFEAGRVLEFEEYSHLADRSITWLTKKFPLRDSQERIYAVAGISADITERKRVEETLQKQAELIDLSPDGIITRQLDGIITFWSKGAQSLYGWTSPEAIGQQIHKLLKTRFLNPLEQIIEQVQQTGYWSGELTHFTKDGRQVFVQSRWRAKLDDQGNVREIMESNVDITDRKLAEEALREAEETARQRLVEIGDLYRNAPVGLCVLDRELRWVRINERLAEINGIPAAAHIGKRVRDLMPQLADAVEPEMFRVMETGQPRLDIEIVSETPARPSVKRSWLEQWLPITDSKGKVTGLSIVVEETTERKRAEKALREAYEELEAQARELQEANEALSESEKRYRLIFDNSMDAIILTDPQGAGKVLSANPAACRLLGWSEEELIGKERDVIFGSESPVVSAFLDERACSGSAKVQITYRRKDGTILIGELSSTLFTDINREPRSVTIIRDITERKRAEEELSHQREMLQQIFDNIPVLLVMWNPHLEQFTLNQYAENVLGWTTADANDGDFMAKIYPDAAHCAEVSAYMQSLATGWREWIGTTKKGQHVPIDWANIFLTDDTMIGIGVDLRERKAAEEALRESEKLFRTLAENSPDVIIRFDGQKRHIYANPAATGVYGYSQEEIIRKTNSELGRNSELVKFLETYQEIVSTTGKPETMEFYYKSPQGKEYYFNTKIVPEFTNGKVTSILTISRDITDIKEAEEELKETLDNLEEVVKERTAELEKAYISLKEGERGLAEAQKMAHLGNWVHNIITGEVCWSDEVYRIFGFKPQEFGVTYDIYLSYVHPDDRDFVVNAVRQALNGKFLDIEHRIVLANGEERIIHERGEVVFDDKNNPVLRGTVQDITKRKKTEESLANIEIARKKEIHHRIKNNLQVISSLLDLQAEQFRNRENIKDSEVLGAFRESQDRVVSMALIHEELYRGGGFETLNFSPYIEELTKNLFLTYRLGNADISLKTDLEENLFFDMDTAVPLGMIVNELVSNSLKHAFIGRDKGEILIKLCRTEPSKFQSGRALSNNENFQGTSFILTISDNGVGIPENLDIEDLDSLGFQLVTSLVDQLDGEFELKRNNGTEFIMRFTVVEKLIMNQRQPTKLVE